MSHSTNVQNAAKAMSSMLFSTIVQIKQDCRSTATLVQNNTVNVGTPTEVMNACIAGGWNPKDCAALKSTGLSVYNISQTGAVTMLTKCQMDSTIITQLQASLTNQINQQLAQTTDGITGALKSLISATQNTKDSIVNTTDVSNFVSSTFKLDAVQTAVNKVVATQNQVVNVQNADQATVHDISQAAQIEATLDVLQSNSACATAIASMDNNASQKLTTVDRGVADIVSSIADIFKSLFAALGNWTYAVAGLAGLVVVCSLCSCAATLFSGHGKDAVKGATALAGVQTPAVAQPPAIVTSGAVSQLPAQLREYLPSAAQVAALVKAFK